MAALVEAVIGQVCAETVPIQGTRLDGRPCVPLERNLPALRVFVVDLLRIVKPTYVQGRLQTLAHDAPQYHITAPLHVPDGLADYFRFRDCNI